MRERVSGRVRVFPMIFCSTVFIYGMSLLKHNGQALGLIPGGKATQVARLIMCSIISRETPISHYSLLALVVLMSFSALVAFMLALSRHDDLHRDGARCQCVVERSSQLRVRYLVRRIAAPPPVDISSICVHLAGV